MLRVYVDKYIHIGTLIHDMGVHFSLREPDKKSPEEIAELDADFQRDLKDVYDVCKELSLKTATTLIEPRIKKIPESHGEFDLLVEAIFAELKGKLFLFVPDHLAKYYDVVFQSFITTAFPLASKELVAAGDCLAAGLYTASVFHAMRAAEIGVRVLGKELGVEFPDKPIELAEWQNILDQCDSKIVKMKELPRGTEKDGKLGFYSQAAVQFRYFKDAWRVRVAHARETYEETAATRIFSHTHEFFETLATRLKEPKPSV